MKSKAKAKVEHRKSFTKSSGKSIDVLSGEKSKVDPMDESIEHVVRRTVHEKEKQRSKNFGMYL
mgnify:CR=1 FL=1